MLDVLVNIFLESSKEQHLLETNIFCKIWYVFTVTFDQLSASFTLKNKGA